MNRESSDITLGLYCMKWRELWKKKGEQKKEEDSSSKTIDDRNIPDLSHYGPSSKGDTILSNVSSQEETLETRIGENLELEMTEDKELLAMLEEEGFQVKDMSHLLGISHDKVTRANWEKDIKNITRQTGKKTLKIKI